MDLRKIAVVGLGYVGLANKFKSISNKFISKLYSGVVKDMQTVILCMVHTHNFVILCS